MWCEALLIFFLFPTPLPIGNCPLNQVLADVSTGIVFPTAALTDLTFLPKILKLYLLGMYVFSGDITLTSFSELS